MTGVASSRPSSSKRERSSLELAVFEDDFWELGSDLSFKRKWRRDATRSTSSNPLPRLISRSAALLARSDGFGRVKIHLREAGRDTNTGRRKTLSGKNVTWLRRANATSSSISRPSLTPNVDVDLKDVFIKAAALYLRQLKTRTLFLSSARRWRRRELGRLTTLGRLARGDFPLSLRTSSEFRFRPPSPFLRATPAASPIVLRVTLSFGYRSGVSR